MFSIGIIIFTLGNAKIKDDELALPLMNVVLEDASRLVILVWAAMVWLLIRYYNVHHRDWKKGRDEDVAVTMRDALGLLTSEGRAINIVNIDVRPIKVVKWREKILFPKYRNEETGSVDEEREFPLKKGEFAKLYNVALRKAITSRPSLLGYFFPYLVWLAGVVCLLSQAC